MKLLAALLLLLNGYYTAAFPSDGSLTIVPSPNNHILYEQISSAPRWPEKPVNGWKIASDVPLTIQRYDDQNNLVIEGNPIDEGDSIILVTSNCDTSDTDIVPIVDVQRGKEEDKDGATFIINVELGIPSERASAMPFLESSSYDSNWLNGMCGPGGLLMEDFDAPEGTTYTPTPCMTARQCDLMRQGMGMEKGNFQMGDFPTKGCFAKNGIVYWSSDNDGFPDSDLEAMSKADLPGVQERVWCQKPTFPKKVNNACMTEEECDELRTKYSIGTFQSGNFPTKGCFIKNGAAYWGRGGSTEEMSTSDLPGVQQRIWCGQSVEVTAPSTSSSESECEVGPGADPAKSCNGSVGSKFCLLSTGVCNDKSGIHVGVCKDLPDACIELYEPVCGCDGKTYSNECKAHSKGINVSRSGKCEKPTDSGSSVTAEEDVPCLSENTCNRQRLKMGIDIFYSSDYPTKGCFMKNGKAYWSSGGTVLDKSETNLPGVQQRIFCDMTQGSLGASMLSVEKSNSNTIPQSDMSSAFSLKSIALTSVLHKVVYSEKHTAYSHLQVRNLDTCTYNVEVLISGCHDAPNLDNLSAPIEVSAPKARVIQSDTKIVETKTHFAEEMEQDWDPLNQYYYVEFNHTSKMSFPDDQAEMIKLADGDTFTKLPFLDDDVCWLIVCGRPFVDSSGKSLVASTSAANYCGQAPPSWLVETSLFESGRKTKSNQATSSSHINNTTKQNNLGNEWTKNALGEHASVASFAAFSIALMTNNAPSDLIEDSLKASLDEVRHAKISFDIASKLLDRVVSPGPLPPSSHQFEYDMTSLAMSVAKEGCIGETLSALAAAAEVELIDRVLENGAVEGTKYFGIDIELLVWIRNELLNISIDESRHSALAWRTLDWVCTIDAESCNTVRQSVLAESKLIIAFQRHFGRSNHSLELRKRAMSAWKKIYDTNQKNQTLYNATADDCVDQTGIDNIVKEGSYDAFSNSSLFSLLVENVLQRDSCRMK